LINNPAAKRGWSKTREGSQTYNKFLLQVCFFITEAILQSKIAGVSRKATAKKVMAKPLFF
jgi:hypothetical protein